MKIFGKEHIQQSLRLLHNRGIEMTPNQVTIERKKAFETIRTKLREKGFNVPESDEELFILIKLALTEK